MNSNNNDFVTKKDLTEAFDKFEVKISERFDEQARLIEKLTKITEQLDKRTEQLDKRTEQLDKRTEQLDKRTEQLGKRTEQLDMRTTKNEKTIDRLVSKVIEMDLNMATKADIQELRNDQTRGFDRIIKMLENQSIEMKAQDYRTNRIDTHVQKEAARNDGQDQLLEQHDQRITVLEKC